MEQVEILIVGQGPAGLSAAIYAGRAGMRTVILGSDPKVAGDYTIDNYFGFPEPITGKALIARGIQQARRFQVDGMVMHANRSCKPFSITQSDVRDTLREELGLPILILEADQCDERLYNEGSVQERVAAFLEMLA